jgi:hypothetical protein
MFKVFKSGVFQITFENNVTVSITIAGGSYSDNHDLFSSDETDKQSLTAEVAVIGENGEWLTKDAPYGYDEDVAGYLDEKEVLEMLIWAESL